jgi:RecB family exonuclease
VAVTEFKDYLTCPYRYYLRHVRNLHAIDDSTRELEGGAFGTLVHKVLGAFGRDRSVHHENDNDRDIFAYLEARLGAVAEEVYGSGRHRPAIRLQIEQARRRLSAFASCQAQLAREGWCIVHAEDDEQDRLSAPFPGEPIALVGRIDRIDFNLSDCRVRILDYKTSDTSRKPEQTHRNGESWVDLQLPLYRHLWAKARLSLPDGCTLTLEECAPELGYFNLPKQIDKTGIVLAEWDAGAIADADRVARQVIQGLCAEDFETITRPAPKYSEDFAAICLDNALSPPGLEEESEGGPA